MSAIPNKQAVNKAEIQLTKDVDVLMAILAGVPPSKIIFHTLACFPDASSSELQVVFCADCLESGVICQEDLADLSLPLGNFSHIIPFFLEQYQTSPLKRNSKGTF